MGLSRLQGVVVIGFVSAAIVVVPATNSAGAGSSSWSQTAQRMASVLTRIQRANGTFPAYNYGGASGEHPYGESMVGYGLIDAGIAADDRREIHAGLRAVGFAAAALLRRGSPSVFEDLALASAYNRARRAIADDSVFRSIRPRLERALRAIKPVWNGTNHRYFNKCLVEAVAWLELARTGLHSSSPGTVLANPRRARAVAADLVNRLIGSPALGLRYTGGGGLRALILSDLPYNPAAYQGLSLGMLARALTLLGHDATPHAWRVLRAVATASWELIGPDGDLAYYGRSQEQAWALGLTAYGAEIAADHATIGQTRHYRALAVTAMKRLSDAYPVGPRGLWMTPAAAQDLAAARRGLDHYADSVAYTGLALVANNWAAQAQSADAGDAVAGDAPSSYVVGQDSSRIALVRTPQLWLAVKQTRSNASDLRYDFGLVAMKALGADGSWRNVVPSLPRVQGEPDSAGPVLELGGARAYPSGRAISVGGDGTVTVHGSFVSANGRSLRSRTFRFEPVGDCVTQSFALRRGERVVYSAFVRTVDAVSRNGVAGAGERVTVAPQAASFAVDRRGYSSGSDASLRRVRFAIQGAGEIRITTCSDR